MAVRETGDLWQSYLFIGLIHVTYCQHTRVINNRWMYGINLPGPGSLCLVVYCRWPLGRTTGSERSRQSTPPESSGLATVTAKFARLPALITPTGPGESCYPAANTGRCQRVRGVAFPQVLEHVKTPACLSKANFERDERERREGEKRERRQRRERRAK